MSFNSAQWTIPELCVWIVTRSRAAVNGLLEPDTGSLQAVDRIHPGVYAVRHDVVAAAQDGSITISYAGDPDRKTLPAQFWKDAEIADSRSGWMSDNAPILVARREDRTGKEFRRLRVGSLEAQMIWPMTNPAEVVEAEISIITDRRFEVAPRQVAADDPPPQFVAWAALQHSRRQLITEQDARTAMTTALGADPGRNTTRRWLRTLDDDWKAVRGTPPSRKQ